MDNNLLAVRERSPRRPLALGVVLALAANVLVATAVPQPAEAADPGPGASGMVELERGEWTRDAYDDILAVDSATGYLWLYPGTVGGNNFGARKQIGTGWNGYSELTVGQFNRDAYDDLAAVENATGKLWLYPGTAAGSSFGTRVEIGSGGWNGMNSLIRGRLNRDSYDDLGAVEISTGKLWMYPGTSAGGAFGARVEIGSGGWNGMSELTVARYNRDSYDDIGAVENSTGKLWMYPGTSAGGAPGSRVEIGSGGWNSYSQLTSGRFNCDDWDDLLAVNDSTRVEWVYPGTAAGGAPGPRVDLGTVGSCPAGADRRSMVPGDSADVGSVTPTLHSTYSDADGNTGYLSYEVYNQAGTLVTSGNGPTVASGADSAWTVPSGKLVSGTTYRWRSHGTDSTGLIGRWSSYKYFNTQNASITGEQRRFQFEERTLNDRHGLKGNVANGNLLLHATDLQIRGTGIDFTLDRYYNSRATSVSALGKGWTMGIGQDVKLILAGTNPTTSDVTFVAPSFYTGRFDYAGSSTWRHPPGIDADLSWNSTTSEWQLKFQKSEGSYFFNTGGQLIRQEDRNNNDIRFEYTSGLLTKVTDTQDRIITLTYSGGLLDTVTDPTGRTLHYYYTADGNVSDFVDANGKTTNYRYDPDRLSQITTAGGSITNITYLGDGTRRVQDFTTQYDPGNGQSTSAVTTFSYSSGETKVTDPNGNSTSGDTTDGITTYRYDDRDRVTKVIDALGHTQDKKYTSGDNIASTTDALQKQVTFGWDPNDENLTSVSLPTGAKSTMEYANTSHPHSVSKSTDPQGNTLAYSYDTAGNKTATESSQYPGTKIEQKFYNSNGTVDYALDGNGTKTDYTYDAKGNLTNVDNPTPLGDITLTPDALSRLKTQTDGKSQTTTYTYDPLDRQDVVTYNDGSTVDQDWDDDGNLTQVTDATGITKFAYNKMNRQIRKTLPNNTQIRYEYDHNGNLALFSDSGGNVTYGYDQVNNLTSLLEPGASTAVTFGYDDDNRRTKVTFPTSPQTVVDLTYDDSGRQKTIKAAAGTSTLTDYTYSYSKNGVDTALRQSMTDAGTTTTYGYDGLNRLTSATGGTSRSYGYDIDFNRSSKTESGTTTSYGYNAPNQLTTVNGTQTYNYDGNGNLTGGGGWSLGYNAKNQTTTITKPGGTALSPLVYAGQDQTERVQAGLMTYSVSMLGVSSATNTDSGFSTLAVDSEASKPAKGSTDYYTRDNRGGLISLRTAGSRYYYLLDGLGSVAGLIDSTGAKVNSYKYDPYGVPTSVSQNVANPWRYASGQYDGDTGLTKFGARYYNPDIGRFTQRDPSGKDLAYTYASCNPTNYTDPTGQFSRCGTATGATTVLGGLVGGGIGFFIAGPAGAAIGAGIVGGGFGGMVNELCTNPDASAGEVAGAAAEGALWGGIAGAAGLIFM